MSGRNITRARPRDERAHPVVRDAIDRGFVHTGEVYTDIGDLPSHDIANQSRRLVKNAGQHLGVSVAAWVADADGQPCYRNCADPTAPHKVLFRLFTKNSGRAKVVQDTGGDPSKLRYNPWKRNAPRLLDDDGQPVSQTADLADPGVSATRDASTANGSPRGHSTALPRDKSATCRFCPRLSPCHSASEALRTSPRSRL